MTGLSRRGVPGRGIPRRSVLAGGLTAGLGLAAAPAPAGAAASTPSARSAAAAIDAGRGTDEVVAGWQAELARFRATRDRYLLYR
jgi:hypothetical protein